MASCTPLPHVAIFPFMAKGHTIPLIHLAHLIHRRRLATLTFFTTPLNAPFLRDALTGTEAAIVELPFPQSIPNIPPGVESADGLPSLMLFVPFVDATKLLRPQFELALESLPAVTFLISDGFLGWTNKSAARLGIPRIAFYGIGGYAAAISAYLLRDRPHAGVASNDEPFTVQGFPQLRFTMADVDPVFVDPNPDPESQAYKFTLEHAKETRESQGILANSFYGLESVYFDHWNHHFGPKAWCVGPVCLAQPKTRSGDRHTWMEWLDSKLAANRPVLYVAFGTLADVSEAQLKEIALGLERSGLDFLWVVRHKGADLGEGFEERVGERGKVVREWVDQWEILMHGSVKGFVSHCGWNSTLEGICAGVPFLAWPMMADQPLNAKFLVEELRIAMRIRVSDGLPNGFVRGEDFEKMVKELMLEEKGMEAASKAMELANAAWAAIEEGGSSWVTLELLIKDMSENKRMLNPRLA